MRRFTAAMQPIDQHVGGRVVALKNHATARSRGDQRRVVPARTTARRARRARGPGRDRIEGYASWSACFSKLVQDRQLIVERRERRLSRRAKRSTGLDVEHDVPRRLGLPRDGPGPPQTSPQHVGEGRRRPARSRCGHPRQGDKTEHALTHRRTEAPDSCNLHQNHRHVVGLRPLLAEASTASTMACTIAAAGSRRRDARSPRRARRQTPRRLR